jgi:hypothetical protein
MTNQFYSKTAITGSNGSGKTATAMLFAIGLAIQSGKRPVVTFDSEKRHVFWQSAFAAEGIPLIVVPGRSFKSMNESLRTAQRERAAVWIGDSLTPAWQELVESFALPDGRLPVERQSQLRRMWNGFVVEFLDAQFHGIGCGRLGWEWVNAENADGNRELVKGDPKFKAGGGESFGYDCHLELEMRRHEWQTIEKKSKRRRIDVSHICTVVKDATGALSTLEFQFRPLQGGYKTGAYRRVYECLLPHLKVMENLPDAKVGGASSRELLVSGESEYARDQKERAIALEKFTGTLNLIWPGQTAAEKRARAMVLHQVTGTLSMTEVENNLSTPKLIQAAEVAGNLKQIIEQEGYPAGEEREWRRNLMAMIDLAMHPEKNLTFLEVMGAKSVKKVLAEKEQRRAQAGD